jgi:death-on-curing protein
MFDPTCLCDEVRFEYERWMSQIIDDPYESDKTLGIFDVMRAHFLIANYFYQEGEGIGGIGPKDINLLHSALYRQHVSIGGVPKWSDRFDICATLMFGLIKDHAFHDANKRTAFLVAVLYLYNFGRAPSVTHKEFEDFTVEIADDKLSKYNRYSELVKKGDPDPEVKFISYYLRKYTREIDKRFYSVTYRELKRILNRFDCDIENPRNNYIDIIKKRAGGKSIFVGNSDFSMQKVGQIGFPGWGAQVRVSAMKTVRSVCELTPEFGIDSQVFFKDLSDLESLIAYYQEPLRRLADR